MSVPQGYAAVLRSPSTQPSVSDLRVLGPGLKTLSLWNGARHTVVKVLPLQKIFFSLPIGGTCRTGDGVPLEMDVRIECQIKLDKDPTAVDELDEKSAIFRAVTSSETMPVNALLLHADAVCRAAVLDMHLRSAVVDLDELTARITAEVDAKGVELGVRVLKIEIRTHALISNMRIVR